MRGSKLAPRIARRRGGSYPHPNLTGQWDATKITGLNDGDPVPTWTDLAGVSDMAQATSGNRPTYKVNIRNSLPIVRFDFNDWMDSALRSGSAVTLALAFASASTGPTFGQMWSGSNSKGIGPVISAGAFQVYVRGVSVDNSNVFSNTSWQRHIICAASGDMRYYINGVNKITNAHSWIPGTAPGYTRLGGTDGSNSPPTPDFFGSMDLGEALIFNAALNSTDVAAVDAYLSTAKW